MKLSYNTEGKILGKYLSSSEDFSIEGLHLDLGDELFYTIDINNQYIDVQSKEIISMERKPESYYEFNWQTKQWDYLPEQHKQSVLLQINQLASQKINTTYPIYKQLNIESDFGKDSTEYQTMRTFINSVRTASNNATAQIQTAETEEAINTAFGNYKAELEQI